MSNNQTNIEHMMNNVVNYKKRLSTEPQIIASVGENNDTIVTRQIFSDINSNLLNRVYTPIEKVLKLANLTLEDTHSVELLGGASRMPCVQERLLEQLQNRTNLYSNLTNINGAVALGAAFIATNYSSFFESKGKGFELNNGNSFDLVMKFEHYISKNQTLCPHNYTDLAENCTRKLNRSAVLLKARGGIDFSKTISFKHDGNFDIYIYQRFPGEPIKDGKLIMVFKISDIQESLYALINDNIKTKPTIDLKFKINRKGFLSLTV